MTNAREVIAKCIKDTKGWRGEGGPDASTGHIIAALAAAGLVIVPVEPTLAMMKAGSYRMQNGFDANVYRAMVETADDK
ncbi:MAG: hypothetical protein EBR82_44140 [Caulobacteraceae bacterium]|nr:hypothetical protein [Caulobacteraceae bacterium]